jgi:hypothetical protein
MENKSLEQRAVEEKLRELKVGERLIVRYLTLEGGAHCGWWTSGELVEGYFGGISNEQLILNRTQYDIKRESLCTPPDTFKCDLDKIFQIDRVESTPYIIIPENLELAKWRANAFYKAFRKIMLITFGVVTLAIGSLLSHGYLNSQQRNHNHQRSRIERVLYDFDEDGKYDAGTIRTTFKDGCLQVEELPWYATGKTRKDYEEIFKRIDSANSLQKIEETLTFK